MIKKIIIAGLSLFLTTNAIASEEIFSDEIPWVWQSIITLSGGPAWTSPGLDQISYVSEITPLYPTQHYIPNSGNQTIGAGEIFFGLQRVVSPGITAQLGLGIAGAFDPEISGVIVVENQSNLYTYRYNVEHARLELKGKLIASTYRVQPYVSGSFGVAMNSSHNWQATSEDPVLFPPMVYGPDSNAAFAYSLGAGIQAMLNAHWQVGVGYEFADLGKSGLAPDELFGFPGITLTHLYTNELLFSISYLY